MEVTVVIPAFNAEKFIEKAIESASKQIEVKEVIVVDDKSTDNTLKLCYESQKENSKLQVYRNESDNKGAGVARNIGIHMANCKFIAFLDADDYYLDNRFIGSKEIFEEDLEVDGVYEHVKLVFLNESAKLNYEKNRGGAKTIGLVKDIGEDELFKSLWKGKSGWIHLNGLIFKKDALLKVGYFDESLVLTQDTDFILRSVLLLNLKPSKHKRCVSTRTIHGKNVIFDEGRVENYSLMFSRKWLNLMIESNWPLKINWYILRKFVLNMRNINRKKKLKKGLFFILDLIRTFYENPIIICKFIRRPNQ